MFSPPSCTPKRSSKRVSFSPDITEVSSDGSLNVAPSSFPSAPSLEMRSRTRSFEWEEDSPPIELQSKEIGRVMRKYKGVGMCVVQGLEDRRRFDHEYAEEKKDEDAEIASVNSRANSAREFRGIVITKSRKNLMEKLELMILGENAVGIEPEDVTLDSNHVLSCFEITLKPMLMYNADTKRKFDTLLGFTHCIFQYDSWLKDSDGADWDGDDMLLELGEMWLELLRLPDDTLGIDSEFTRPGVMSFIAQCQMKVSQLRRKMVFIFG